MYQARCAGGYIKRFVQHGFVLYVGAVAFFSAFQVQLSAWGQPWDSMNPISQGGNQRQGQGLGQTQGQVSGWVDYGLTYGYSSFDGFDQDLFDESNRDGIGSRIGAGLILQELGAYTPSLIVGIEASSTFEAFPTAWADDQTNLDDLEISSFDFNVAWWPGDLGAVTFGVTRAVMGGEVALVSNVIDGDSVSVLQGGSSNALSEGEATLVGKVLDGYRIGYQFGDAALTPRGRVATGKGVMGVRLDAGYGRLENTNVQSQTDSVYRTNQVETVDGLLVGVRAGGQTNGSGHGWGLYGTGGGDLLLGSSGFAMLFAEMGAVYRQDQWVFRGYVSGATILDEVYGNGADGVFAASFGAWELMAGVSVGLSF